MYWWQLWETYMANDATSRVRWLSFLSTIAVFSHICHQTHLNHPFSINNWDKSKVMAENGWLVGFHASHNFGFYLLAYSICSFHLDNSHQ
jgi:hypothetical protein